MSASDNSLVKVDTPEDKSSTSTSTFTTETNTRATTPDFGLVFNYRTILIAADEVSCLEPLEAAFIKYEPFETWSCAFCEKEQTECNCQARHLGAKSIPETRPDFVECLGSQEGTASALQASLTSYLLAIEKHVPFGKFFNANQKTKCGVMNQQLELIKERLADLKTASQLFKSDEFRIPEGIRKAYGHVERLLANCHANATENHVCLKLNFTLAHDGNSQKLLDEVPLPADSKSG